MKPADPDAARLLRWYPRGWRERYGEEFLAMVEDGLNGGRPGRRLRLSVAWAGLRERGHRARLAGQRATLPVLRALTWRRWTFFLAGSAVINLPYEFRASSGAAQRWQATAAIGAIAAVAALGGAAVLTGAILALPAFGRFLRAGGWPRIRRRVASAAGATAAAGSGMAALVLIVGSRTYDQLRGSWAFSLGGFAAGLVLAVAFGLWASAVKATATHLDLPLRVRVGEMVLGVVTTTAVFVMLGCYIILSSAIYSSVPLLLLGVAALAVQGAAAPGRMRQAVRRGRRRPHDKAPRSVL